MFELPPFWRNSIAITSGVGSILMMAPIAIVFAGLHGSLNSYRWEDVLGMAMVLALVFGIAGIPVGIAVVSVAPFSAYVWTCGYHGIDAHVTSKGRNVKEGISQFRVAGLGT